MQTLFVLKHLCFGVVIAVFSAILTRISISKIAAFDEPNERSSHTVVTPRGGGVAIFAGFFLGVLLIQWLGDVSPISSDYFLGFVASTIIVGVLSFYDDFFQVSFKIKLVGQFLAIAIAMLAGLLVDKLHFAIIGEVNLGFWAYPLTFVWMFGMTNAYNFIDGLDGFAASTAFVVAVFFAYITASQGSYFVYLASLSLAAATLGFLFYNWSPAKIFMGDIGSTFLGLTFATLAIIAARYDHSHTSFWVMPLLVFHYIFHTVFTFVRRLMAKENVFLPHRTHIYQLLNRIGYTHRQVALGYAGLAVIQGLAATWMVQNLTEGRGLIYIPFTLLYFVAAIAIVKQSRRRGISA